MERAGLDRVIAVINGKGGVGKTTLTANVAGLLARSGYRVLVVDMDPQGNLGLDLGYADGERDDAGRSLGGALLFGTAVDVVTDVRPGLDVLVGGEGLHHAQAALAAGNGKGQHPREALATILLPLASQYDVVMVDCPPGSDALQAAAMAAAKWVIVPARADTGSAKGLEEVARRLAEILDINPDLDLLGVALFDVEVGATRVLNSARQMVADTVGDGAVLFDAMVRHSSAVAQQARSRGLLVHELDDYVRAQPPWWKFRRGEVEAGQAASAGPRTAANVADDLHSLTLEIIARLTAREAGGAAARQEVLA